MQSNCTLRGRDVRQVPERSLPQGRRGGVPRDGRGLQRSLHAHLHLPEEQNQVQRSSYNYFFLKYRIKL